MIIREANKDDAKDIANVHIRAWREAYDGFMPKNYLKSLSIKEKEKQWSKALSSKGLGVNLVIERNNSVVGFCVYGPVRDKDLSNKNLGELVALNILPEHWGKGLGSSAIQYVIQASQQRNWNALSLWVLKQNLRARNIYEKFGFVEEGTEKTDTTLTGHKLEEIRYIKELL